MITLVLLLDIFKLEIERLCRPQLSRIGKFLNEREEFVVVAAVVKELCERQRSIRSSVESEGEEREGRKSNGEERGERTDAADKLDLDAVVLDPLAVLDPDDRLGGAERASALPPTSKNADCG
jgi:uncharacterized protein (UPF0305 family)